MLGTVFSPLLAAWIQKSVIVCCCRVPLFKWMSSWKLSGDAHFLRVSLYLG